MNYLTPVQQRRRGDMTRILKEWLCVMQRWLCLMYTGILNIRPVRAWPGQDRPAAFNKRSQWRRVMSSGWTQLHRSRSINLWSVGGRLFLAMRVVARGKRPTGIFNKLRQTCEARRLYQFTMRGGQGYSVKVGRGRLDTLERRGLFKLACRTGAFKRGAGCLTKWMTHNLSSQIKPCNGQQYISSLAVCGTTGGFSNPRRDARPAPPPSSRGCF